MGRVNTYPSTTNYDVRSSTCEYGNPAHPPSAMEPYWSLFTPSSKDAPHPESRDFPSRWVSLADVKLNSQIDAGVCTATDGQCPSQLEDV
jgi:hypothetical protein